MGNGASSPLPPTSYTRSTIRAVPDTETGSHILTIDGFSRTRGRGPGKSISSGSFTVGGHSWHIAFYPDGQTVPNGGCDGWVSVFVYLEQLVPKESAFKARFKFSLFQPNGKPATSIYYKKKIECDDTSISGGGARRRWGFPRYVSIRDLRSHVVRHDSFLIKCDVTVIRANRVQTTTPRSVAVPPPDLHRHFGDILVSHVGADITFDVGVEMFMAHKVVLAARSSVFMAVLFGGQMGENAAVSHVKVDDMDPDVFGAMLHFIYTDTLPEVEDGDVMVMAQHLLVAADKYSLGRLKLICEDKLCGYIDSETVVTMLVVADPSPSAMGNAASSSKSTILAVPDIDTGSHILTIDGYSRTRGRGDGTSINSGSFTVGGHSWHIAFFPDGETVFNGGRDRWVSIFVYLEQPAVPKESTFIARFKFNLLKPNGKRVSMGIEYDYNKRIVECDVDTSINGSKRRWGFPQYVRINDLSSRAVRHDSFQIKCDVTVIRQNRVETTTSRSSLAVPPPDLHRHLSDLLVTHVGADVTFEVGKEVFMAHKAVLATRSSVFMAELFGHMKEKEASRVRVDDVDPDVFRAMLHFVYTDSVPEVEDGGDVMVMAQHLLVAADKYNLERLKVICEDKLCGYIDTKTVVTMLLLADRHGCKCLQEACVGFLKSRGNLKSVLASGDFEYLMRSYPSLLKELLPKNNPECVCPDGIPLGYGAVTRATARRTCYSTAVHAMSSRRRSLAPAIDDGYSASTAFAETATGWHMLRVKDYSQINGIGFAKRMIFPDGPCDETPGWVCFGLRLEHHAGTSDFRVRVKFTFLDNAGNLLPRSMISGTTFYIDSIRGGSWYNQEWMKRGHMEYIGIKGDSFTIRCEVTVLGNVDVKVSAVVPPSDLHRHLGDLLSTGVGADVAFDVAGETFAAHRAVLATRSPVFMAEFFGCPLKEPPRHPKVFEALLYFIYNDALPETDRGGGDDDEETDLVMAQHLLVPADMYSMERLASMCEFTLCIFMNESVAVSTLVLPEQHGRRRLKEACFRMLLDYENYKEAQR
ncbi:hypothetical protein HU200_004504 [Digitaria exilis]|uniref:Uncharacterized protein n=1 Tax=Digitaria exilis TaxID=1010633 RepID=A0A835KV07_9POAL|nr:hypothetical protein HU200_004504 [Digitaria exilis]